MLNIEEAVMNYLENKLMEFSLKLIDENKAKIIVPVFAEEGYWFGGGNMVEDELWKIFPPHSRF